MDDLKRNVSRRARFFNDFRIRELFRLVIIPFSQFATPARRTYPVKA